MTEAGLSVHATPSVLLVLGFFGVYPSKPIEESFPILGRKGPKNPTFLLRKITPNTFLINYGIFVLISKEPRVNGFIIQLRAVRTYTANFFRV